MLVRFLLSELNKQARVHVVNKLKRQEGDSRRDDELRSTLAAHYARLLLRSTKCPPMP
jgi:hypothetical protein